MSIRILGAKQEDQDVVGGGCTRTVKIDGYSP